MGNINDMVKLGNRGDIVFRVNWDQYDHQHSGGLLAGLFSDKKTGVDCDVSAFVIRKTDKNVMCKDFVTYDHPTIMDDAIVHYGDNTLNGDEEEKIGIRLGCISMDEEIVFTLDTLKNVTHVKMGKLSRISVLIETDKGKNELYRGIYNGTGNKAIQLGKISWDGNQYYYKPVIKSIFGVNEKPDLLKSIIQLEYPVV